MRKSLTHRVTHCCRHRYPQAVADSKTTLEAAAEAALDGAALELDELDLL
jgi:hypothetical protein